MPSDRPVSPEAAPPRTTTSEQRDAITRAFLTPDVVDALTAECEHVGAQWAHIEERIAGARVALARVRPPFSPETDRDGLYYPLLFLVEAIAEYQRDIDATGSPVEAPVAPSRASGAPDGTDRGAATLDTFAARCKTLRFLFNNLIGDGGLRPESPLALLLEAVMRDASAVDAEVARLRALSTGEPSPDSAALPPTPRSETMGQIITDDQLAELRERLDRVTVAESQHARAPRRGPRSDDAVEELNAADEALFEYVTPAVLRSLHARLTAAERDAARMRAKYELLRDAVNSSTEECSPACDQWGHEPDCPRCNPARWLEDQQATIVSLLARVAESARYAERYRAVVEFYAEADEDDGGKTARAALPPSGDTRGEQP